MYKKILLVIILVFNLTTIQHLYSQDYLRSLGIKTGNNPGAYYRKFADDVNALELIASFQRAGIQFMAIREFFQPMYLAQSNQFFVFYGVGMELGYTKLSADISKFNNKLYRQIQPEFGTGISGIIGIEYHSISLPFALSVEYIPVFQFYLPYSFFNQKYYFAVSIAYTF